MTAGRSAGTEQGQGREEDLRDDDGNFLGKRGTDAEHRTVGDYRAWCFDCGEWCYPSAPCGEPKCCAALPSPCVPPARDSGRCTCPPDLTFHRDGCPQHPDAATDDEPWLDRDPHWIKDRFELDDDEPLHEVQCPSCGVTIRARMADAPDPGGRDEAREAVGRALSSHVAFFWGVTVGIDRAKLPEFWDEVATVALDALPPAVAALLRDGTTT